MTGVAEALPSSTQFSGVHADLSGLAADDHLQYVLLAGRAGGQLLNGGTASGEFLGLRGSAAANRGRVEIQGGADIDWDFTTDFITGGGLRFQQVIPASGGTITSNVTVANSIVVNNALFIMSALDDLSNLRWTVSPGFAVTTLFFARQIYRSTSAGIGPAQTFVYAAQCQYHLTGAGAVSAANYRALSFAPIIRVDNGGDDMRIVNTTGVIVNPLFNTRNAFATADYGTIRGVHMANAGTVLFGQALGAEIADNWIGVDMEALTGLTVSGVRAGLRSAIPAGASNYLLQNLGGAQSEFGNGDAHFNDAGAIIFGTGNDVEIAWDNAAGAWNWDPAVGEDLGIAFGLDGSKPTYLFEAETFGVSEIDYTQIRFGFDRFAFGQTGSIGNQVGVFTAGPRTVEVAGGWADYLLTQGGNLTIGTFAMSDVSAWVINSISLANTAGSIASLDTLVVGAMTTSNPGITVTERSALRVTGRLKQRGSVQYPPITPATLGAGDNDDWAGLLTGSPNNNGRYWARVSGNATTSVITGIDATAVQDGDTFELTNIGSENILVENEGTGSAAANRIITGQGGSIAPNFVLSVDRSMALRYDGTSSRWRVITPPGAVAPLSGHWRFDTTTTMADPGSGTFRNNNGTLASVTAIAISDISFRGGDASAILSALASGDQLYIQNAGDAAEFMVFNITGVTDNTTWFQIDGTAGDVGNAFSNNNEFNVIAIFA